MAAFAERAVASGRPVDRGECWDVANAALKNIVATRPDLPAPIPSIARTHGHLIFEARPGNGRWRGGDTQIRRGDVAEWRRAKLGDRFSYSTLGDPDHTQVIVADAIPTRVPIDGGSITPAELGAIEVVEQSQGHAPSRRRYDLTTMTEGELWIYRPVRLTRLSSADRLKVAALEQMDRPQPITAVWPPPIAETFAAGS